MDPGKKPAAKVSQLDDYLLDLGCNLWAIRLQSGFDKGDFSPHHSQSRQLITEAEEVSKKRMKQDKKKVERPVKAPPFLSLFRESHTFASKNASVDKVLDLVDSIQNAKNNEEQAPLARSKEINWQSSSGVFCNRLLSHYVAYEDVAVPIANSVRNIQYGLRELCRICMIKRTTHADKIVQMQDSLLQYPIGNLFETYPTNDIGATLRSVWDEAKAKPISLHSPAKQSSKRCQLALLLSSLARMDVQQRACRKKADCKLIEAFDRIVMSVLMLYDGTNEISPHQTPENRNIILHKSEAEDERSERLFREQFPDHAKEFCEIVESIEYADDDAPTEVDTSKETEADTEGFALSDDEVSLLCELHRFMFLDAVQGINDHCRIRAFKLGYDAASQLNHVTQWMESKRNTGKSTGAHMMALCLHTITDTKTSFTMNDSAYRADFHHDANPTEVLKADAPLQALLVRIGQLHRAFPGNSILLAVGQVVERMRQLDLNVVSVGKVLSGLEIILRKAQEWEQHASKRVTLGTPLKEISMLVSHWRKLELQSWPQLLDLREHQYKIRTRRHWIRLYKLVNEENKSLFLDGAENTTKMPSLFEYPSWVCKGSKGILSNSLDYFDLTNAQTASLNEFIKCIDTFLLTAGIADFPERLCIVGSFANQMMRKCETSPQSCARSLALARTLQSLWEYYNQFAGYVLSIKEKLRAPIEKSLKDEAKIAKWDEQTYYSLADSADKSHKKLMKFLSQYDSEVLEVNVGTILEQHFISGVRSSSHMDNHTQEPVTSVPRDDVIFPHLKSNIALQEKTKSQAQKTPVISDLTPGHPSDGWVCENLGTLSNDKYLKGMKRYYDKMGKLLCTKDKDTETWASRGSNEAASLCETIFSRIGALRGEKVTKPMKQRALVDLFKALKKHGYSNMKWSVPSEVREMIHILQLPIPTKKSLSIAEANNLEEAESYFYKCTLELNRLRSEVSLFGSQYMSQREMLLMTGFSDHGFLMLCQQRCLLAKTIDDMTSIKSFLDSFANIGESLPLAQEETHEKVSKFEASFASSKENLEQLLLLIKMSTSFTKGQIQGEKLRDRVSIVEGCVSSLSIAYEPAQRNVPVTKKKIHQINVMMGLLESVKRDLSKQCEKSEYLPAEVYEPCLSEINTAISFATDVAKLSKASDDSHANVNNTLNSISSIVESSLLSFQGLCEGNGSDCVQPEPLLWESHRSVAKEWNVINLNRIKIQLKELNTRIMQLHESEKVSSQELFLSLMACENACSLVHRVIVASRNTLADCISFFRNMAKLTYILIRIFRVLVAKGFCADSVDDGADGEGDGDLSNMKFEDDVEGTGMGEGDGKNDVTDQIENEEQLLGLKGDEGDEKENASNQNQLNEEEAEQGMEMEADFDGEMFDVPEKEDVNEDPDKNEEEEELDREMGDGDDPNENVVDEKMWDDEDDNDDVDNAGEEKFEKDSKVSGGPQEDELRTKDDDEGAGDNEDKGGDDSKDEENPGAHDPEREKQDDAAENDIDRQEETHDEVINDDTEDKYEDRNENVDVRDNAEELGPEDENDEGMNLNDDLDLDSGAENEKDGDENMEVEDEVPEDGDEEKMNAVAEDSAADREDDEEGNEEDGDEVPQTSIHAGGDGDAQEEKEDEDDETGEQDDDNPNLDVNEQRSQDQASNDVQGISCENGADSAKFEEEEKDEDEGEGAADTNEAYGANDDMSVEEHPDTGNEGNTGKDGEWQSGDGGQTESMSDGNRVDAPNPLVDPGDAEEFWHKKLDMIESTGEEGDDQKDNNGGEEGLDNDVQKNGVFEYTKEKDQSTTQVLGGVTEEDAAKLDDSKEKSAEAEPKQQQEQKMPNSKRQNVPGDKSKPKRRETQSDSEKRENVDVSDSEEELDEELDEKIKAESDSEHDEKHVDEFAENKVFTDIAQLEIDDAKLDMSKNSHQLTEVEQSTGISSAEATAARLKWSQIQANTLNLSRRLCEKLRLVMEPLVATKLQGDYRTGKRINMKRVIGYIASGYRKDKIWLRRTKPSKRNYRVLLAVDDSESMQKSGAGDMALAALAVLSNGMNQLEIGELGVASFGEEMKLLHQFHQAFTSESGPALVSNFTFDQKRTRMALCVESAIAALEGDTDSSMKLVFLISDGRIERDSRSKLRKLVREMTEKNILLVVIIVEGDATAKKTNKDSIVNMKEVTFENGKPKVKYFIEDYPFPYYMILEEMSSLPEVLGDALRQWFEMLAQIQSQGTGY
mmetsp:Transcript_7732/g.11302  ORF Transcript_7732/g.11302 Transcript_7732/m.11302 type:complete len:2232 (-) Transcript_7732:121-6816(-)